MKKGNKFHVISVSRDVTERKKAEEQVKAANQQLQASEQQLKASNQELAQLHSEVTALSKSNSSTEATAAEQGAAGSRQSLGKIVIRVRED